MNHDESASRLAAVFEVNKAIGAQLTGIVMTELFVLEDEGALVLPLEKLVFLAATTSTC